MTSLLIALLHSLWQGVLVAVGAHLALRSAQRPEARCRIGELALTAQLVAFLGTWWWLVQPGPTMATPAVGLAAPLLQPLAVLWLVGAGLLLARWSLGQLGVWRLRRASVAAPPIWTKRFQDLSERLGLWNVELRLVPREVPMAVGVLRPVVLLPASLLARMPADQIEALLLHELAHIRRNDVLFNALQGLAEALLFHHPVTWWLSRLVRNEREVAADALAARITGDPVLVARALAELAHLDVVHAAPAATSGSLRHRVHRLLGTHPAPRSPSWVLPLLALAVLLGVAPTTSAEPPPESDAVESTSPRQARLLDRTARRAADKAERHRERAIAALERARDAEARAQQAAAEAGATTHVVVWSSSSAHEAELRALELAHEAAARAEIGRQEAQQRAEEAAVRAEVRRRQAEVSRREAEVRAEEAAERAEEGRRRAEEGQARAAEAEERNREARIRAVEAAAEAAAAAGRSAAHEAREARLRAIQAVIDEAEAEGTAAIEEARQERERAMHVAGEAAAAAEAEAQQKRSRAAAREARLKAIEAAVEAAADE